MVKLDKNSKKTNNKSKKEDSAKNDYKRFFVVFIYNIIHIAIWVVLGSNFSYITMFKNNESSIPTNINIPPYSKIPKMSSFEKRVGTMFGGNPFTDYKYNYGFPYDLKDTNSVGYWFGQMMATSWSSSRAIFRKILDFSKNLGSTGQLILGPLIIILGWLVSNVIGFCTTLYGSLQSDITGIILTVLCAIFGPLWIISSVNASLQALLFSLFFITPLFTSNGRDHLRSTINQHSNLIFLMLGLMITANAYNNLNSYVGLGMLIMVAIMYIPTLF
uniref:Uncharacterized protein n=1 Tax=viral metagenome TaxID=1070528 RepID=A0A6C0KGB5_9ZZZZ